MRSFKIAAILAVGTCIAILVAYPEKSKSPPLGNPPQVQFPSENLASTAAKQFLDGSFSLINDVRNLPVPVLRAFTEQGGSRLLMANPGKDFRVTDVIHDPTLPSKRLIFAGILDDKCFVHYEEGGIGHSYVVALFKITSKDTMKPIWRGYCGERATSLEDLRLWVGDGRCSQP
jgi:hypothetical protein